MYAQIVLVLIGFSTFLGVSIVIPVLPHYAMSFGASPFGVTAAFAVTAAMSFVSSVLWGRSSDRWGRKPIVVASLFGQAFAFFWLSQAGSMIEVYAARALEGLFAGNVAALIASMADITSEDRRTGAIGRLTAAFSGGFIVGPALGGVLTHAVTSEPDFALPFLCASALFLLLAGSALVFLPESRRRAARAAAERFDRQRLLQRFRAYAAPEMSVPLLGAATVAFASNSTAAIFALWALERFGWDVTKASYAITAMAFLVMTWNLAAGRLSALLGNHRLLALTQLGIAAAFLGLVYVESAIALYLVLIVAAFGNGIGRTVVHSVVASNAGPERRGEAVGVVGSVSSLVTAGGPLLAGWLFVAVAPSAPFAVIAATAAVTCGTTLAYLAANSRRPRPAR